MNVVDQPITKDVKLKMSRGKTAQMARLLLCTGSPYAMYTISNRSNTKSKCRAAIKRLNLKSYLAKVTLKLSIDGHG